MADRKQIDPRDKARGQVLKRWREEVRPKLTQVRLGLDVGYEAKEGSSKNVGITIAKIEAGQISPSPEKLEKILKRLLRTQDELDDAILRATARVSPAYRLMAGTQAVRNEERRAMLVHQTELLKRDVETKHRMWSEALQTSTDDFVIPFITTATCIQWPSAPELLAGPRAASGKLDGPDIEGVRSKTRTNLLKQIGEAGASGVAGVGVGAAAAAGVFGLVSATATASTGTAISALSGVALTNATLAWLGGGTLATGGMGMAGGTLVLGGIVALPVLIAMGGLMVWKGRKLRNQANQEVVNLHVAETALLEIKSKFGRAFRWAELAQDILGRATDLGSWLQRSEVQDHVRPEEGEPILFEALPVSAQAAITAELDLVALVADTQALPIWLEVTSVDPAQEGRLVERDPVLEPTTKASQEWIEGSLVLAGYELDAIEGKWRDDITATL